MKIEERIAETKEILDSQLEEMVDRKFMLSDAILAGIGSTEQARGWGDGLQTSCALNGAAVAAYTYNNR